MFFLVFKKTGSASVRDVRSQFGEGKILPNWLLYLEPRPNIGATRLRTILLSKVSPAMPTPSVPMTELGVLPALDGCS